MRLGSLRGRFLLAILLWVMVGIGGIWYSSVRLFTGHVESQYHEELEVHVRELGGLTSLDAQGRPHLARPLSDPRYAEPLSGFYWQITRPGFGTLKSPSMTRGELDYDIAHSPSILHRVANGPTGPAIVYGFIREAPGGPPLHFVIATDERHLQRIISAFTRELTVWLALLALALLASGLAIITFGLRPFNQLSRAIDALRKGERRRIDGRYPDEIEAVVSDLNAYIDRNAEIVERGRVEASSLAHSLRTPLAVITDEAERLLERGQSDAAKVFLDQSGRMQRQIDYHLARVRSGGSKAGMRPQARLAEVLPPLLDAMRRCHPGKRFVAAHSADATLAMDEDDLSEILSNLLDNAGKWAASEVRITFAQGGSGERLLIEDDGPGLAPENHEAVFGVGHTGSDGNGGSGLGLAISRAIARDYGGDVQIGSAAAGSGACLVLLLP
ncbi:MULTISPECIES: HAMP domain-containing sensor histidine kinase [Novosphingobium]|uniref:ATP-binding protein n=1 Tax=Novosphingobium TaxID=165696 RepID=UPI000D6EADDE|nr:MULTISPECIES: HAMP domain-containing sensor histidine kinase [Novosphingobium]